MTKNQIQDGWPFLSFVVALARANGRFGAMGRQGGLPWHIPEDLKYFKRLTMGKAVLMGRATYQSIGRPLPGRTMYVISRTLDKQSQPETVHIFEGLEEARQKLRPLEEVMVIGGAQLYAQLLPVARRLYLTEIDLDVPDADCFFPALEAPLFIAAEWRELACERRAANGTQPALCFRTLERR